MHRLPSSQLMPVPAQRPAAQRSLLVQAVPSSQGLVLLTWPQPVRGLQESVVQIRESSQFTEAVGVQDPPAHLSPEVQALPSSQVSVLGVMTQPRSESQYSVVQGLASSQDRAPPAQTPALHLSPLVQASPSSQGAVLLTLAQPVAGLQESVVHRLLSLQSTAAPALHKPRLHLSPVVQALSSLQSRVLLTLAQPVV